MKRLRQLRWWLVGVSVVLLAGLAGGLGNLRLDNSFEIWFPENEPALAAYRDYLRDYGNDEVVVVAIRMPQAEAREAGRLAALEQLTAELGDVPGVAQVASLSSLPDFDEGDLFLDTEIERFVGHFVDKTDTTYKLLVTMQHRPDLDAVRPAALSAIDAASRVAFPDNTGVWLAGAGVVLNALNVETMKESAVFLPLSYAVILGLLAYLTRSWRWSVLAVVVLCGANVAMFGLMGWMQRPITMITMALPPIALVVTICSIMHLQRRRGPLAATLKPIALSALTSAGGFFSLAVADMAVTRDYGFFAGVVILVSLLLTLTGACFVHSRDRVARPLATAGGTTPRSLAGLLGRMPEALDSLVGGVIRRKGWIVGGCLVLLAVAAVQIRNLQVDTYSLGFLPDDHRVQADNRAIEAAFGPYVPLEFVLQLPSGAKGSSLATLGAVHKLQRSVTQRVDGLGESFSYVDAVLANVLLGEYSPEPNADALDPSRWIDDSGTRLRITWTVPMASAGTLAYLKDQIVEHSRDLLPDGATLIPAGYLPLYSRLIDRVMADQLQSLSVAVLVVFGLIVVSFRDVRTIVLAAAINLPPIVLLLTTMALMHIPLDIATITVAPAMLGLIVDDSIHLLYRFRRRGRQSGDLRAAAAGAVRTIGPTLVMTSVVLLVGFAVLGFSTIDSIAVNGLLMAWTVVLALVADLLLLPATAAIVRRDVRNAYPKNAGGGSTTSRMLSPQVSGRLE